MTQPEGPGGSLAPSASDDGGAATDESAVGPQRLQTAIRITTPASWVIAAVLGFLTVAVIVWGVLGQLSTRVSGLGVVLTEQDDILVVRSQIAGTVTALPVAVGDDVKVGDLLARLGVPGQEAEIERIQQRVELLRQEYLLEQQQVEENLANRLNEVTRKIETFEQRKIILRQRIEFLTQELSDQEDLLRKGPVVSAKVQDTREQLADARIRLNEVSIDISDTNQAYLEHADGRKADVAGIERELLDARAQLKILRDTRSAESVVRALVDGRVIDMATLAGAVVGVGEPLLRIDAEGGDLRVVGYFEAADGKKVGVGMDANVAPSTAETAIWGTLVGKVVSVAELPATIEAVSTTLGNRSMAEQIFASGPPIVVEIALVKDSGTPSGLKWSSGAGPPYAITPGTISGASVVVRKEAPANLVIPVFKRWVGHGD